MCSRYEGKYQQQQREIVNTSRELPCVSVRLWTRILTSYVSSNIFRTIPVSVQKRTAETRKEYIIKRKRIFLEQT